MTKCIYCLKAEPEVTFTRRGEHVVPQGFGTFGSNTPTLKCVCASCNQYFGDTLDIALTRDSLEAMQRYKHGIRSSARRPHKRVTMELADDERPKGVPKLRFEMDGTRGEPEMQTIVRLIDREKKEEAVIRYDQTDTFDITPWLKRKLDVELSGDKSKLEEMYNHLVARGLKFTSPFNYTELAPLMGDRNQVLLDATGIVDTVTKRGVAKILFNFVAYYMGEDIVLDPKWDTARAFIRYGTGKLSIKIKTGVFWDDETEHIKYNFPSGANVKIENADGTVVGFAQFFDMMIYEVELAEDTLPEEKLVGFIFCDGMDPIELRPLRIKSPLLVAKYDVDSRGRARLKVQKYGQ
ncbi:MAG: HNH endonuclease [Candidatus Peregrinibacteria bacterium]